MAFDSNQTWLVFQSPILESTQVPENTHSYCVKKSSDHFFKDLSSTLLSSSEALLDIHRLIDLFPTFRNLVSPEHALALYAFLMECRANFIGKDFIYTLTDTPLSPRLQRLFFLFHEYLLFKENNAHLLDPWDLTERASHHPLPFSRLIWVDFHHHTTFSKLLIRDLSACVSVTQILAGPKRIKEHTFSLDRLARVLKRARNTDDSTPWVLGPNAYSLWAHLSLILSAPKLFAPKAFSFYDDIYGFHLHEWSPDEPLVAHERPEPFWHRAVSDHVLPDQLTSDPLWTPPLQTQNTHALELHARLWTQYVALSDYQIPLATPGACLIQARSTVLPTPKDLLYLETSELNCHISPAYASTRCQAPTMLWVYANTDHL